VNPRGHQTENPKRLAALSAFYNFQGVIGSLSSRFAPRFVIASPVPIGHEPYMVSRTSLGEAPYMAL
jgi:hypothetical protein